MRTRLVTITLAAMLALLGAVAILAYVRQANERAINGLKAETVLVAEGPIPAGTSLSDAQQQRLLGTEKVPVSSLTTAALQSVTATNEHLVVSGTVARGQVLLQNMLAATATNAPSSGFVIPPNMIAISIDVCVPEAVADYVTPGSYVAVFETTIADAAATQAQPSCSPEHQILGTGQIESGAAATGLVLAKVQVLAVGQNLGTQSTSGGSNVSAATDPISSAASSSDVLVTVAVTQAQAQELILLGQVGIPYLALLGSSPPNLGPTIPFP